MYEFTGQDSAGFRGGEVEFQVSEFFEPMGMSRRILPWARAPVAISVETSRTSPKFPVPNSMCPGWLLRAGRARANLPGSDVPY
eukprot:COSAG02_NODE_937_length_15789_cov_11.515360_5_plen_84_part_00